MNHVDCGECPRTDGCIEGRCLRAKKSPNPGAKMSSIADITHYLESHLPSPTPTQALAELVAALNRTYWSMWQSKVEFQPALASAEALLAREQRGPIPTGEPNWGNKPLPTLREIAAMLPPVQPTSNKWADHCVTLADEMARYAATKGDHSTTIGVYRNTKCPREAFLEHLAQNDGSTPTPWY